ncbi:MAG: ABC transporter ATP-binding protein [Candidatus Riflebacteria bacterium]|nr:ABC transporter ATP-binding protein [Candidatus Riflebacteria bacterium]
MACIIKLKNCSYRVKQPYDLEILRVLDFCVESGEQCIIHGPSGSGKTTLFNIIGGLLCPTSGEVEVASQRLDLLSEHQRDKFRGRNIGFIFQSYNLLQGLTALENVLLGMTLSGCASDKQRAMDLLDEVGLNKRSAHYPFQLSSGEQQRVAVARALAHKPSLILADEPTGALDPIRSAEIIDLILSLSGRAGCTILVITHDPDVVRKFPKAIAVRDINKAFESEMQTKEIKL